MRPEDGGATLMVRVADLPDGLSALKAGDVVKYDVSEGFSGPKAVNVRRLSAPSPPAANGSAPTVAALSLRSPP